MMDVFCDQEPRRAQVSSGGGAREASGSRDGGEGTRGAESTSRVRLERHPSVVETSHRAARHHHWVRSLLTASSA